MGLVLEFNIYGYVPHLAAGIVFIVVFGLMTLAALAQLWKTRLWWFGIVLAIGGIGEVVGWAGRTWSSQDVYQLDAFLMQIILILAPCFYSATAYGSLGMLIRAIGLEHSIMRPMWYLIVFCTADLIAIVIQAVGGGMAAIALQNGEESETGTHIMVAGVVCQMVAMIVFVIIGVDFYWKASKSAAFARKAAEGRVRFFAIGLVHASFWILVRCIYRTVELAEGWTGYLITHEPYFLCLDSLPMVFTMATFLVIHPAYCLPDYRNLTSNKHVAGEKMDGETAAATPTQDVEK